MTPSDSDKQCQPVSPPPVLPASWHAGETLENKKTQAWGFFGICQSCPCLASPLRCQSLTGRECQDGTDPAAPGGSVFPTDLQRAPALLLNCVGVGACWEAATPAQSGTKIGAPALPFGAVPIPGHVGVMEGGMLLMERLENPKLSTGALSGGFPKSQASCGRC